MNDDDDDYDDDNDDRFTCRVGMRWFVVFVGMIGLLCILIGIILGVLGGVTHKAGSEYVTVALLLIGKCRTGNRV